MHIRDLIGIENYDVRADSFQRTDWLTEPSVITSCEAVHQFSRLALVMAEESDPDQEPIMDGIAIILTLLATAIAVFYVLFSNWPTSPRSSSKQVRTLTCCVSLKWIPREAKKWSTYLLTWSIYTVIAVSSLVTTSHVCVVAHFRQESRSLTRQDLIC